jgi:hypothetical protein
MSSTRCHNPRLRAGGQVGRHHLTDRGRSLAPNASEVVDSRSLYTDMGIRPPVHTDSLLTGVTPAVVAAILHPHAVRA